MDPQLVQRSRYVLKARLRHALTCPVALFPSACAQFYSWIGGHPVLGPMVRELERSAPGLESFELVRAGLAKGEIAYQNIHPIVGESYREHAGLCARAVAVISTSGIQDLSKLRVLLRLLNSILTNSNQQALDKELEQVRDVALKGLYEYLDEQIDSRNAVFGVLLKYKQRAEWFRRQRLRSLAVDGVEGVTGELALALDLGEYLLDQGVEFTIEPTSASGLADLVLRASDDRHIIVDAKYASSEASPSDLKRKLRDGFHQVARYCEDYGEEAGHLVVFLATPITPRLALAESDGMRFRTCKGKQIYYHPIVIADLPSASKSGLPREVAIEEADLTFIDVAPGSESA